MKDDSKVLFDKRWTPKSVTVKKTGPFFVEIKGEYSDGSIRELSMGPWSDRKDAKTCLELNKKKLRDDGATKVTGYIST